MEKSTNKGVNTVLVVGAYMMHKLPRRVEVLTELPKTAIGKLDKKLLAGE